MDCIQGVRERDRDKENPRIFFLEPLEGWSCHELKCDDCRSRFHGKLGILFGGKVRLRYLLDTQMVAHWKYQPRVHG